MIDDSSSVGPVTMGNDYDIVLVTLPQWVCSIHGSIGGVLTFDLLRLGFAEVRQYCPLCVEDALLGAGMGRVWRKEDE